MNRLACSLPQILRRCKAPAAPRRLLHLCSSARLLSFVPRISSPSAALAPLHRGLSFGPRISPASVAFAPLRRQLGTAPPLRIPRWYHDPRKVAAAAAAALSATAMAVCDHETVPCTNRSHLVSLSTQKERDLGESCFAEEKAKYTILDPRHPDSVRVRLIAEKIIHAANRGLGVDDSRDAPILRVTQKRPPRRKNPQTSHLLGLNWEVVLAKDDSSNAASAPGGKIMVFTGLLDCYKTDGEIAAHLAHEIGHLVARHHADIMARLCLPAFLGQMVLHRMEVEADRIGILLLGAAGFHPHYALDVAQEQANSYGDYSVRDSLLATHPHPKNRLRLLSEAKTMEEALELYREATAMDKVTEKYFSGNPAM